MDRVKKADLLDSLEDVTEIVGNLIGNGNQYRGSQDDGFDEPLKKAEAFLTELGEKIDMESKDLNRFKKRHHIGGIRLLVAHAASHRGVPHVRTQSWGKLLKNLEDSGDEKTK